MVDLSRETGIYSYELKNGSNGELLQGIDSNGSAKAEGKKEECLPTKFWGRSPAEGKSAHSGFDVSPTDFFGHMERDKLLVQGSEIGSFLDRAFELVKNTRMHAKCRTNDRTCPRIRSTPNNPESSRGHLFTIPDVTMKGSHTQGTIAIVDMAGSEKPVAIAKD